MKIAYILLGTVVFFSLQFCAEQTPVQKMLKIVKNGGALRNLKVENNFFRPEMNSKASILFEAQTADGGESFKELNIFVGFNDVDTVGAKGVDIVKVGNTPRYTTNGIPILKTISASDFNAKSTTTHGLPAGKIEFTLQELADHLKIPQNQFSLKDQFTVGIQMVLNDGRKYDWLNASSDITRTGKFSYFNSQFFYTFSVDAKILKVALQEVPEDRLKVGTTDTVFWRFNYQDKELDKGFTVRRISQVEKDTSTVGLGKKVEKIIKGKDKDKKEYYYMLYTASNTPKDTIFLLLSGAAVYPGVVMKDYKTKAIIIDNTVEFTIKPVNLVFGKGGKMGRVFLELDFGEPIFGAFTVSVSSDDFDDFNIDFSDDGQSKFPINFVPTMGGEIINEKALTIKITVSVKKDNTGKPVKSAAKDLPGNSIDGIMNTVNISF